MELERLKIVEKSSNVGEKIQLTDFCNRTSIRGLIIGAAMAWFLQLTGCFIFINYAMVVFQKSNTMMNPHISSIVLAVVQIFGGLLSTSLSDTFGRKVLLVISLLGSALGLFSLSTYLYCDHIGYDLSTYSSLPVVCLSFVIFIVCAGIAPLSNVCTVENLPPEVSGNISFIFTIIFLHYYSFHSIDSDVWYDYLYIVV